jgi:hypothetical protein
LAEGEGFEPPVTYTATTVFKTVAFVHSAIPPSSRWETNCLSLAGIVSIPRREKCVKLDDAPLAVVIGHRERDALALFVYAHDDELAGLGLARHVWGAHLE